MASANLLGAVTTFLAGDSGDLRTAVNTEQAALLGAGSVYVARENGHARGPRFDKAKAIVVELVPQAPPRPREIGIGVKERSVVLHAEITARQPDGVKGANQITTADKAARAIVARYDGVSAFTITATGATFARSEAEVIDVDEVPDSHALVRAVVRLEFAFIEAQRSNS